MNNGDFVAIHGELPCAHVVVLTTHRGDVQTLPAIQAGAQAYPLNDEGHKEKFACPLGERR